MSDDEPRFTLTIHNTDLTGPERRELERMIHHALDGDAVFAVEGIDPDAGDLEALEEFVEGELRNDE